MPLSIVVRGRLVRSPVEIGTVTVPTPSVEVEVGMKRVDVGAKAVVMMEVGGKSSLAGSSLEVGLPNVVGVSVGVGVSVEVGVTMEVEWPSDWRERSGEGPPASSGLVVPPPPWAAGVS